MNSANINDESIVVFTHVSFGSFTPRHRYKYKLKFSINNDDLNFFDFNLYQIESIVDDNDT